MDAQIKVNGLDELKRRLNSLEDGKLQRSIIRSGSRKAAKVLKDGQMDTVPVSTGELRDSIGIQVKGTRSDQLQVLIGPDKKWNYIGRFNEFGTKFLAGEHWMLRAWNETKDAALDAFITEVKRRLDVKTYQDLMRAIEDGLNTSDSDIEG